MFAVHIVTTRKRVVLHMGLTDDINRRAYKHRDRVIPDYLHSSLRKSG